MRRKGGRFYLELRGFQPDALSRDLCSERRTSASCGREVELQVEEGRWDRTVWFQKGLPSFEK